MRFPGFVGPSYTLGSVDYDCQRCINMFPEINEMKTGKDGEVAALVGTPGLTLLNTIGTGPVRGLWYTTTGSLYMVSGNKIYLVTSTWQGSEIGTLNTTTGQVSMVDNGLQLVIVDGPYGYYVNFATSTFTQITDPNFYGSNVVTFQDGYFIFQRPNTRQFYISDLNDITFNNPSVASKDGDPDNLIAIISVNRNLWLMGDISTELWFNSGDNNNPFQYASGTLMQYGIVSPYSLARMGNTICWLGKDQTGQGIVYMANGYSPQRISTNAIEIAIQGYSKINDAIGFSYQENGHMFFVLTFPTGNATWVYDSFTQLWHERAYTIEGVLNRHRANCYANAFGTVHVVGDWQNGNLYQWDLGVYSDNGAAITRQRITPHASNGMKRIFFKSIQLDFQEGTGLDGLSTVQGHDPQAMLQWSNDGGNTWSNEHWVSMGKIGETAKRAIWRRLGFGRNRVFKLTITDPVKVYIMGAEIELEVGAS